MNVTHVFELIRLVLLQIVCNKYPMSTLIETARQRLHQQGGRMTAQRQLIFQILEESGNHLTAEEVYSLAKPSDPTLHLSTVYRALRWLESENLVMTRLFQEERRQERFDAALPSEHHHFICTSCKTVAEFDTNLFDRIKSDFEAQSGAHVETGSIILYGLCAECYPDRPGKGRPRP